MENSPKVSIVTSSYNQGQYLEDTIKSVINQEYPNLEYIIIDGDSSDNSKEIIKKYEKYLKYWVSEPDKGPADAINKGMKKASGDILAYLNSDDILLPGAIELAVKSFKEHSNSYIIYGNAFVINTTNQVINKLYSTPFFNPYLYVLKGCHIAQQATFWKKEIFDKIGGFNVENKTCWDAEMWVDIALQGVKFHHINQFIAAYRRHPSSITISISGRLAAEYKKDFERLFKKVFGRFPSICDRYIFMSISRILGKLMPPQRLFPSFGISGLKIKHGGKVIHEHKKK